MVNNMNDSLTKGGKMVNLKSYVKIKLTLFKNIPFTAGLNKSENFWIYYKFPLSVKYTHIYEIIKYLLE